MSLALAEPVYSVRVLDLIPSPRNRTARAAGDVAAWLGRLELEGKRPRSISGYAQTADRLLGMFPGVELSEVTPDMLETVLRTYPAASQYVNRSHLSSLFKYATTKRIVRENPMQFVAQIRRPRRKQRPAFTVVEKELLMGLPGSDGALMSVLFLSGIRLSEALALQGRHVVIDTVLHEPGETAPWSRVGVTPEPHTPGSWSAAEESVETEIDDSARGVAWLASAKKLSAPEEVGGVPTLTGRLLIKDAKGGKDRDVQMRKLAVILNDLILYEAIGPKDYLWGHKVYPHRLEPLSKSQFYAWFDACLKEAGVSRVAKGLGRRSVHSTRHTHAYHWVAAGGSLERLSVQLGHESLTTTYDLYVRGHMTAADVASDLALVEA